MNALKCKARKIEAVERCVPFRYERQDSLLRGILASVHNLCDGLVDFAFVEMSHLASLRGSMRHVAGSEEMTDIWESKAQSVRILLQSCCQRRKGNRWFLQRIAESRFDLGPLKAPPVSTP